MENITYTYNLDIALNAEQNDLINSVTANTDYTAQEILSELTFGNITWEHLEKLNEFNEYSSNPNSRWYSTEEVEETIKTGIIPE